MLNTRVKRVHMSGLSSGSGVSGKPLKSSVSIPYVVSPLIVTGAILAQQLLDPLNMGMKFFN